MRTNIVLNEDLVREAMRYSRARTRRALVEEALEAFVALKAEERRRVTYAERVRGLQARLDGLRLRQRPTAVLREDRERA